MERHRRTRDLVRDLATARAESESVERELADHEQALRERSQDGRAMVKEEVDEDGDVRASVIRVSSVLNDRSGRVFEAFERGDDRLSKAVSGTARKAM